MDLIHISNDYFPGLDPNTINNGMCFYWEALALHHYGGTLYSSKQHCFIKIHKLYYDAHVTCGVKKPQQLPHFATTSGKGTLGTIHKHPNTANCLNEWRQKATSSFINKR